jgi:CHASE1-domain containing sensor protein
MAVTSNVRRRIRQGIGVAILAGLLLSGLAMWAHVAGAQC